MKAPLLLPLAGSALLSLVSCTTFPQQQQQNANPYGYDQNNANPYGNTAANPYGQTGYGQDSYASQSYTSAPPEPSYTPINPPATSAPINPAPTAPAPVTPGSSARHTVVAGDSLWGLARKYNTTVEAIQSANGLQGDVIQKGRTLTIPQ